MIATISIDNLADLSVERCNLEGEVGSQEQQNQDRYKEQKRRWILNSDGAGERIKHRVAAQPEHGHNNGQAKPYACEPQRKALSAK
jgi:hypothetical protein